MLNRHLIVALSMLVSGPLAAGQDILIEKNISLALATEAAQAAVAACEQKGYKVAAAVVDRAGRITAQLRADSAGPHTLDSSRRKAYTSASLRESTSALFEITQKYPTAMNLPDIDGFLILGGGLPIRVGNEVIGAIGVGGAPGAHLDEACAQAGVDKIGARLK